MYNVQPKIALLTKLDTTGISLLVSHSSLPDFNYKICPEKLPLAHLNAMVMKKNFLKVTVLEQCHSGLSTYRLTKTL